MQIGIVGLGKMGYNLALNLRDHGHQVHAYDLDQNAVEALRNEGGVTTPATLQALCEQLAHPRVVWMMVPAGEAVDALIQALLPHLSAGDFLIDGGNSNFNDTRRRHDLLLEKGVALLDCGTSGGTSGARNGACTMIGGAREAYLYCKPVFDTVSLPEGSLYVGEPGAGHFVKMVHNGIEYGMMQAIAEGFEVLEKSGYTFDLEAVAKLWNRGSVIRGWLMELTGNAFSKDARLEGLRDVVHASGEGQWTLETALDLKVPTPVIALALMMRYRSLQDESFAGKLLAALRYEFGGHAVVKKEN